MTLLQAACDGAVVGWGRWADMGGAAVAGPGPGGGPGAARLLPWVTVGHGRQLRRAAPAAWGDFGVGANRGLILFPRSERLYLDPRSIGIF